MVTATWLDSVTLYRVASVPQPTRHTINPTAFIFTTLGSLWTGQKCNWNRNVPQKLHSLSSLAAGRDTVYSVEQIFHLYSETTVYTATDVGQSLSSLGSDVVAAGGIQDTCWSVLFVCDWGSTCAATHASFVASFRQLEVSSNQSIHVLRSMLHYLLETEQFWQGRPSQRDN